MRSLTKAMAALDALDLALVSTPQRLDNPSYLAVHSAILDACGTDPYAQQKCYPQLLKLRKALRKDKKPKSLCAPFDALFDQLRCPSASSVAKPPSVTEDETTQSDVDGYDRYFLDDPRFSADTEDLAVPVSPSGDTDGCPFALYDSFDDDAPAISLAELERRWRIAAALPEETRPLSSEETRAWFDSMAQLPSAVDVDAILDDMFRPIRIDLRHEVDELPPAKRQRVFIDLVDERPAKRQRVIIDVY